MENLFALLVVVSMTLLVIGFFSPKTSLFWDKKNEPTKKRSGMIYGISLIISFILFGILSEGTKDSSHSTTTNESKSVEKNEKGVGVGQVLHSEYFDIVVNKVSLEDRVNTGNEFADLPSEPGTKYLIINASFKNTDKESRMLMEGSVWINYNGKDYEFDKSEAIMLEGWGIDQINPLTSKTTNLVYKIPAEVKGNAYWQPGRTNNDERILLGNL